MRHLPRCLAPLFAEEEITDVIAKILTTYVEHRLDGESFSEAYLRLGHDHFKGAVYAKAN